MDSKSDASSPAPSTLKKYEQAVARIKKAGLDISDAPAVMDHLKSLVIGDSAVKLYLSAIRYTLMAEGKDVPKAYTDKIRELMTGIMNHELKQELSDKQKLQYVPHRELVQIANKLPMGLNKVLASLYTLTPPLRNDFGDMKVVNRINAKATGNVLVMNKSKARFVMQDYKTKKSHGKVVIPLDQKAFAVVRDWFKHLGGQPEYLLGKQMSETMVARHIEEAFKETGKKVGINILRHSYIMEHLPAIATELTARKNLADKMLHSIDRQGKYYAMNTDENK